jgi:hypothetical protein
MCESALMHFSELVMSCGRTTLCSALISAKSTTFSMHTYSNTTVVFVWCVCLHDVKRLPCVRCLFTLVTPFTLRQPRASSCCIPQRFKMRSCGGNPIPTDVHEWVWEYACCVTSFGSFPSMFYICTVVPRWCDTVWSFHNDKPCRGIFRIRYILENTSFARQLYLPCWWTL